MLVGFTITLQILGEHRNLSNVPSRHRLRLSTTEQTFPGCRLKFVDKERTECFFDLVIPHVSMYAGGGLNVEIESIDGPSGEQI